VSCRIGSKPRLNLWANARKAGELKLQIVRNGAAHRVVEGNCSHRNHQLSNSDPAFFARIDPIRYLKTILVSKSRNAKRLFTIGQNIAAVAEPARSVQEFRRRRSRGLAMIIAEHSAESPAPFNASACAAIGSDRQLNAGA
jgi:hypothetical protein